MAEEVRQFNRLEVIDHRSSVQGTEHMSRTVVVWAAEAFDVKELVQDDGKTLKIFLSDAGQKGYIE
jgi:hypothetical protein